MDTAYVSLGSNLGDRLGEVSRAVDAIAHLPGTRVSKVSHAYESEAAYLEDQPPFVNAVVEVETGLGPEGLLVHLQQLEEEMGRVREAPKGPRVIDLDLLLYEGEERASEELTLPHPGLLERDFVITPLLEIAPGLRLPDGTRPNRLDATVGRVVRDLGELPDAGAEHNMPIEETEWAVVAETEGPQSAIGGFDAAVQFKKQVLEQEGIPYAWEPFEPGLDIDVLGRQREFKLVVPVEYQDRALQLFEDVEEAPPVVPIGEIRSDSEGSGDR